MGPELLVDNDVLIKAACLTLLDDIAAQSGDRPLAVLGTARFVVADRLRRDERVLDREHALDSFEKFLRTAQELEPEQVAIDLSTDLIELAQEHALPLDGGESLLAAVLALGRPGLLVTGDKRAIEALSGLSGLHPAIDALCERVVCLEQLTLGWLATTDPARLRALVCASQIDRTLSICFQCGRAGASLDPDCLPSYVNDLRNTAPGLLVKDLAFWVS